MIGQTDLIELSQKIYSEAYALHIDPKINFASAYARLDKEIKSAISEFQGIKTDFYFDFTEEKISALKASLILSDFISVFPLKKDVSIEAIELKNTHPGYPDSLVAPSSFYQDLVKVAGKPVIHPGYLYQKHEGFYSLLDQIADFAQSGKLMIRPIPMVMGLNEIGDKNKWKCVTVHPNTPADTWAFFGSNPEQNAIPINQEKINQNAESEIYSILLPYIDGLPFNQLFKVLNDEGDYINEFRISIKQTLSDVNQEMSKSPDIFNDVLRPSVDKIERRFKQISNTHSLKMAGAVVSTTVLSLAALSLGGIIASLTPFLGASGMGYLMNERAAFSDKKAEIKELPFYLLWKLQQQNKTSNLR